MAMKTKKKAKDALCPSCTTPLNNEDPEFPDEEHLESECIENLQGHLQEAVEALELFLLSVERASRAPHKLAGWDQWMAVKKARAAIAHARGEP